MLRAQWTAWEGSGTQWDQTFVILVPMNDQFWPGSASWLQGSPTNTRPEVCHVHRTNRVHHNMVKFAPFIDRFPSKDGKQLDSSSSVLIQQDLIDRELGLWSRCLTVHTPVLTSPTTLLAGDCCSAAGAMAHNYF